MPWSSEQGKHELMARLHELTHPGSSVLDVGPGAGTYGNLLRASEYTNVDALEVFEPYVSRFSLPAKYRKVTVGDIRDHTPTSRYDLIILGDVLEHISTRDAQSLLLRLPMICNAAIFSVPWCFKQGACEGNDAEAHLQDDLTPTVMMSRFPSLTPIFIGNVIGVYEWVAPPWPAVTVCTLTHARTRLLTHCCATVQGLTYPGKVDHVIINDCPEQRLVVPGVEVINIKSRILSVGEKRNMAIATARGEWLAWVDDDDALLPYHLLKLQYAIRAGASALLSEHALWFCGDNGEVKSSACMDALMQRNVVIEAGGFPALSVGEDWALTRNMADSFPCVRDPSREPSYIEAWCNGAYHVSGQGVSLSAQQRFREDALHRIASGEEPHGIVHIEPTKIFHYESLSRPIITAWKNLHGH
jgi:hypothetical protein